MVQTRGIALKLPVDFRDHPILITRAPYLQSMSVRNCTSRSC